MQIAKVNQYTIHYNKAAAVNQYSVKCCSYEIGQHGVIKHNKTVAKYADLKSCICYVADQIEPGQ